MNISRPFSLSIAFALGCAVLPALVAEETPTITVRKSDAVSLAVETIGGGEGSAVETVLKNDLSLSGWFSMSSPGGASYVVSGSASDGSLSGTVKDRSGASVLSGKYSGTPRERAHQFADEIVETITGNPGIATSTIAFVATKTGKKEIYTADYDGANVKQLTRDGVISVAPAISPDARKLAYTGYQSGYADIYLVELGSGSRNRIIKFPGTNSGAAFSPDGGRIACSISKDGNPELLRRRGKWWRRQTAHAHARRRVVAVVVAERERDRVFLGRGRESAAVSHRCRRRSGAQNQRWLRVLHRTELVAGREEDRFHGPDGWIFCRDGRPRVG